MGRKPESVPLPLDMSNKCVPKSLLSLCCLKGWAGGKEEREGARDANLPLQPPREGLQRLQEPDWPIVVVGFQARDRPSLQSPHAWPLMI